MPILGPDGQPLGGSGVAGTPAVGVVDLGPTDGARLVFSETTEVAWPDGQLYRFAPGVWVVLQEALFDKLVNDLVKARIQQMTIDTARMQRGERLS